MELSLVSVAVAYGRSFEDEPLAVHDVNGVRLVAKAVAAGSPLLRSALGTIVRRQARLDEPLENYRSEICAACVP